jgi:hypothetical protein
MGLLIIVLHWPQFVSLLGFTIPNLELRLKQPPLPWTYVATMLILLLLFEALPYFEELMRAARARRKA